MSAGTAILFALGLAIIIGGAEFLVRGAARLAALLGISPLVIGLTVVAFGTGAPELAVALRSAAIGQADIAVGNVIGSNIFNVLFILGISATVAPLVVAQQLVRVDVPIMIIASFTLFIMAIDLRIGMVDGVILFAGIILYTGLLMWQSRRRRAPGTDVAPEDANPTAGALVSGAQIIVGLALLFIGARWLVRGAVGIATALGVSELVIGLTIVAAGTSLPEVATSIVAGIRGHRDIAVGNVVGSNLYNIMLVLGLAAILSPGGLVVAPAALNFDMPVMIAVAVACLPVFFAGHVIRRWEGIVFLGYWMAYTTYLILDAANHDMLPALSFVMRLFVIPLTIVTLFVLVFRTVRASRAAKS